MRRAESGSSCSRPLRAWRVCGYLAVAVLALTAFRSFCQRMQLGSPTCPSTPADAVHAEPWTCTTAGHGRLVSCTAKCIKGSFGVARATCLPDNHWELHGCMMPRVEVADIVIPVQGKQIPVALHSGSSFDLLCPPGMHITGIQGTKHPQLGITSITKAICNETELSPGLPVGSPSGEEWQLHHALGFSGVKLTISGEQLRSLAWQPVAGGSAEEVGASSTSAHSGVRTAKLACPVGAVLAGLHGQVGASGPANLGVVCRPRADNGDVMLPPAGFQGNVDRYPNYEALCPTGEYVVSFAGTAVADADVRRGSRCRGDPDDGFIASLGPFVCSGNSTLDRAGSPQGAAWNSHSDLGFNKLTVSFYDYDRFILGMTVRPFAGGSTYHGAKNYHTTNVTMQCPDGMLIAGVYGQRGSRNTFTSSIASGGDATSFDQGKVHPDMALRVVNIGIVCRKVAYPAGVTCLNPPVEVSNGVYECPTPARVGTMCNAACNTGYAGTPQVACSTNGSWTVPTNNCTRECSHPPPAAPANSLPWPSKCQGTLSGSTCHTTCSQGYSGAVNVTCLPNGVWSEVSGSCLAKCSTPPAQPAHGTFKCSPGSTAGQVCTGKCDLGFARSLNVTCQSDGDWGAISGTCTRLSCASNPCDTTKDSTGLCTVTDDAMGFSCGCAAGFLWSNKTARCRGSVPIPGYFSLDATALVGGDIHPYDQGCTAAASSLDACARRCAATPFCKVFVFAALDSSTCRGGCWLRTAAALTTPPLTQVLRNPEDSTVTTGIMPVVVPKGLEHDDGGDSESEDIVSPEAACSSGVTSADECASACAAAKGCAGFVLEAKTSTGNETHGKAQGATNCTHACRLQRRSGSDIERAGGAGRIGGGRISGVFASFSHLPDLDLTGPSTSTLLDCDFNGTLHQCAALCAQNEACRAFTWASDYQAVPNCSNPCFMMYTLKHRTQRSSTWGVVSGIRVPRAWATLSWTPSDEAGNLASCCDDATSWNSTLGHCDRDTFIFWANTKFRKGGDDPEGSNVDWCAPPGSFMGN